MCGIAGWCGWEMPEAERLPRLDAMCATLWHRGPDDLGLSVYGDVALGMRRLSILDLDGGRQPMTGADGAVHLVFNGEIFNHDELRRELAAGGAAFATRSDTEVILRLYERHGLTGFERLNGMFAVALWDARDRSLHLVRDRMGVKPLYYHWDGRRLLFASEIKALLASGQVERRVDGQALWDYLTFRFVPEPRSIWEGVRKLPPGHRLCLRPGMTEPELSRYWDIPYGFPPREAPDGQFDAEFAALLDDAVRLRMMADVPVGILLSGGLDSSVVAALAARERSAPLLTFSVAFEGAPEIDERRYAREVAAHLGTEHHEVVIGLDTFRDSLPDLVYHTDEPLADLASVPLLHVCRLARRSVKVVLSGEGSDEILAGYDFERWAKRWEEAAPAPRTRLGWMLSRMMPRGEDLRRWPQPLSMTNYLSSEEKRALLRETGAWPDSFDGLRRALGRLGRQEPLHQALYLYCQDWLVEDLLMKADRMSMAASVELRTPFLDYRLVEWAARVPARLKAGKCDDGLWRSKRILRRLAARLLPQSIVERPKQGFPVPVYDWLSGPLRDFAHDLLGAPNGCCAEWFRPEAIQAALAAGTATDAPTVERHRLWNLLLLECWFRRWLR